MRTVENLIMARKVQSVTISQAENNRDSGKVFILTEMPASQAEEWALRALSALAGSGVDVPDDIATSGMQGVFRMGLAAFGGLPWDKAKPLLGEMFACVRIQPNPSNPDIVRSLVEDDIEEISTRILLRKNLLTLHVGFLLAAVQFKQGPAAASSTGD